MTDSAQHSSKRSKLTTHILIAMALGAAVGLAINIAGIRLGEENPVYLWMMDNGAKGIFSVLGQIFMSLLNVLVVPLVFVSLVCGTAALDDIRRLGRLGVKTVGFYLMTTALAISIALLAAVLVGPGRGFGLELGTEFTAVEPPPLTQVFVNIFPRNVIDSMADGNMLQIIVFSIIFGIAISLSAEPGKRILGFFEDLNEVILKLVWIIMMLAPYGVFALIARTFATQGLDAFIPLLKFFILVLVLLFAHALITYPLLLKIVSGLNPVRFMQKMREVQIFAFSTASSNATIPISLQTAEKRLGVPNSVASFTIPLGATINMDGTAIMQGVSTVFIAQAYGLGLGMADYLTIVLIATLASIGTAGVPGVGIIMLSMVLNQVGLPVEGIALIIGIDRILDMVRTAVNVTGDSAVSCIVAKSENELDEELFNRPLDETEV